MVAINECQLKPLIDFDLPRSFFLPSYPIPSFLSPGPTTTVFFVTMPRTLPLFTLGSLAAAKDGVNTEDLDRPHHDHFATNTSSSARIFKEVSKLSHSRGSAAVSSVRTTAGGDHLTNPRSAQTDATSSRSEAILSHQDQYSFQSSKARISGTDQNMDRSMDLRVGSYGHLLQSPISSPSIVAHPGRDFSTFGLPHQREVTRLGRGRGAQGRGYGNLNHRQARESLSRESNVASEKQSQLNPSDLGISDNWFQGEQGHIFHEQEQNQSSAAGPNLLSAEEVLEREVGE